MLAEAFTLGPREVFVAGSIGIAVYPADGEDTETLVKNADTAMYWAKGRGRNNYQFYSSHMNDVAVRRLELESRLVPRAQDPTEAPLDACRHLRRRYRGANLGLQNMFYIETRTGAPGPAPRPRLLGTAPR